MAVNVYLQRYHKDGDVRDKFPFEKGENFQLAGPPDNQILLIKGQGKTIAAFNSWESVEVV